MVVETDILLFIIAYGQMISGSGLRWPVIFKYYNKLGICGSFTCPLPSRAGGSVKQNHAILPLTSTVAVYGRKYQRRFVTNGEKHFLHTWVLLELTTKTSDKMIFWKEKVHPTEKWLNTAIHLDGPWSRGGFSFSKLSRNCHPNIHTLIFSSYTSTF